MAHWMPGAHPMQDTGVGSAVHSSFMPCCKVWLLYVELLKG